MRLVIDGTTLAQINSVSRAVERWKSFLCCLAESRIVEFCVSQRALTDDRNEFVTESSLLENVLNTVLNTANLSVEKTTIGADATSGFSDDTLACLLYDVFFYNRRCFWKSIPVDITFTFSWSFVAEMVGGCEDLISFFSRVGEHTSRGAVESLFTLASATKDGVAARANEIRRSNACSDTVVTLGNGASRADFAVVQSEFAHASVLSAKCESFRAKSFWLGCQCLYTGTLGCEETSWALGELSNIFRTSAVSKGGSVRADGVGLGCQSLRTLLSNKFEASRALLLPIGFINGMWRCAGDVLLSNRNKRLTLLVGTRQDSLAFVVGSCKNSLAFIVMRNRNKGLTFLVGIAKKRLGVLCDGTANEKSDDENTGSSPHVV